MKAAASEARKTTASAMCWTSPKPGGPSGIWCNDPGNYSFCGANGDLAGLNTDLLDGSLQRVIEFMGRGDINKVPLEGRDLRFYFKQFSIAMAKYLQSGES